MWLLMLGGVDVVVVVVVVIVIDVDVIVVGDVADIWDCPC